MQYAVIIGLFTETSKAVETFSSTTTFQMEPLYYNWSGLTFDGGQINLPSASTTIEINTVTQQIRAFGFMPATTLTSNIGTSQSSIVGYTTPGFPNPPVPVPIYRNANLNLGISVAIPAFGFDTGVQNYQWNGTSYAFTSPISLSFLAEVAILQTVSTGSEVFNDFDTLQINFSLAGGWSIDGTGYPSSLAVVPNAVIGTPYTTYGLGNFTASNGFVHDLTAAPEPSTSLAIVMSLGFFALRRERLKS